MNLDDAMREVEREEAEYASVLREKHKRFLHRHFNDLVRTAIDDGRPSDADAVVAEWMGLVEAIKATPDVELIERRYFGLRDVRRIVGRLSPKD